MDRRGFLSSVLGGAAALALNPERLLWVPGKKLISIPTIRTQLYAAQTNQAMIVSAKGMFASKAAILKLEQEMWVDQFYLGGAQWPVVMVKAHPDSIAARILRA